MISSKEKRKTKMINLKEEIKAVVENDLLDSLLFYGQEYSEHRGEIFKEFEEQTIKLIRQVKKELDD
jgi:5'-deoxynucleotidase YfbR-like HD superfamily hydrolase